MYEKTALQISDWNHLFEYIISQISMIFNEIAQARWNPHYVRVKSASQMKLNPPIRRRGGFHPRRGFHHRRWFHPPDRVDLVEKKHPLSVDKGCFFSGAGYGSRTRLHGLGNIKVGFTVSSLKRKKCSIYNGFSVFLIEWISRIFKRIVTFSWQLA